MYIQFWRAIGFGRRLCYFNLSSCAIYLLHIFDFLKEVFLARLEGLLSSKITVDDARYQAVIHCCCLHHCAENKLKLFLCYTRVCEWYNLLQAHFTICQIDAEFTHSNTVVHCKYGFKTLKAIHRWYWCDMWHS